jgi:hypothetical protein
VVHAARHGDVQPRVVDDVVELRDEADVVEARRVAEEKERDRDANRDPDDMLFQKIRP